MTNQNEKDLNIENIENENNEINNSNSKNQSYCKKY